MLSNAWGNNHNGRDLTSETTLSNLRVIDEREQKELLFVSIRAGDLNAIRNILQINRSLVTSKMFGYEGTDVFEIIKNSKTNRCYTHTGLEKDGFFYPLHVAAEVGNKLLVMLLVKAGADVNALDYRGNTAEEKCNGQGLHGFYELRGFRFESKERYQGMLDRYGNRTGQGIIYFKPEGYLQEEKQLYRGSFKNGHYHGHGTLYWPGTDIIRYTGRFKTGHRQGRGVEFDTAGIKIYQGNFRDDRREGRGQEFSDGTRVYSGEFSNNARHGFGIAYFGEGGGKYIGRFENNSTCGVGISCHPNGDRFEGMFYSNKPDGPGSLYQRDNSKPMNGSQGWDQGTHAIWQAGKRIKETAHPFLPAAADLPDVTNMNAFNDMMRKQLREDSTDNEQPPDPPGGLNEDSREKLNSFKTFSYYDTEAFDQVRKNDLWKIQIGKYLRLPLKEAIPMGLPVPVDLMEKLDAISTERTKNGNYAHIVFGEDPEFALMQQKAENDEVMEQDEEELSEVTDYHFLECTTLFVSYVYVTSASKLFEDRLVNRGIVSEHPDFELVYHLVIDAVDSYNERWELALREQQQKEQHERLMQEKLRAATLATTRLGHGAGYTPAGLSVHGGNQKSYSIYPQHQSLHLQSASTYVPMNREIQLDAMQQASGSLEGLDGGYSMQSMEEMNPNSIQKDYDPSSYDNNRWDKAVELSSTSGELLSQSATPLSPSLLGSVPVTNVESRRQVFMTEKERREELISKQRVELSIKKGSTDLDSKIEKQIGLEILHGLQYELTKLLESEERMMMPSMEGRGSFVQMKTGGVTNHPQQQQYSSPVQNGIRSAIRSQGPSSSSSSSTQEVPSGQEGSHHRVTFANDVTSSPSTSRHDDRIDSSEESKHSVHDYDHVGNGHHVGIDVLFDRDYIESHLIQSVDSNTQSDPQRRESSSSSLHDGVHSKDNENQFIGFSSVNNEFAAELLYIMSISMPFG